MKIYSRVRELFYSQLLWNALGLVFLVSLQPSSPIVPAEPHLPSSVAALGAIRPFEARLTGQKYAPLETRAEVFYGSVIGREHPQEVSPPQWAEAASVLRRLAGKRGKIPVAVFPRDQAVLHLLRQEPGWNEAVITLFQRATAEAPGDGGIWNDLAVAHLTATRPDPPGMYLAIAAADRALQIDSELPEARFNLALALEKASLFHHARRAWAAYLQIDPKSGWANEARKHLKKLRELTPRQSWKRHWLPRARSNDPLFIVPYNMGQIAREEVTEGILGQWAALLLEGRAAEAREELALAERIGASILAGIGGREKTTPDAVQAIRAAQGTRREQDLGQAHLYYLRGMRGLRSSRLEIARHDLEKAAGLFASRESPLEHWAHLALAEIACRNADFRLLDQLAARIRSRANLTRYPTLNGRLFFVEGLSLQERGDLGKAQSAFESAYRTSMGMLDQELKGAAGLKLGEINRSLGDFEWVHLNVAQRDLSWYPDSPFLGDFFRDLARFFFEDQPRLALLFLTESLEIVQRSNDPNRELSILLDRAIIQRKEGKFDDALRDLLDAEEKLEELQDEVSRRELKMRAIEARCQISGEATVGECLPSSKRASKALRRYEQARVPYRPQLTRFPEAEESLDDLTSFYLQRGELGQALETLERGRALVAPLPFEELPKMVIGSYGGNMRSFSAQEFVRSLPPSTTLVEYQVIQDHVVAWTFRGTTVRRVQLAITRPQLIEHLRYKPPTNSTLSDCQDEIFVVGKLNR